jgi:hypothetical protein
MIPSSTSRAGAQRVIAPQAGDAGAEERPIRPTSPGTGTERKPHGEPERPTDKPLPDLPDPTEVGEDG